MAKEMSHAKLQAVYSARQKDAYLRAKAMADKARGMTGLGRIREKHRLRFLARFDEAEASDAHAAGTYDWLSLLLKLLSILLLFI